MESRFSNILKNTFFALVNQIVVLVLNIVNRTIFIKILGIDYLGISGLFSDILMMLSLSDLGLGTAMVYSYYKPISEGNEKKIAQLTFFLSKNLFNHSNSCYDAGDIINSIFKVLGKFRYPRSKYIFILFFIIDKYSFIISFCL